MKSPRPMFVSDLRARSSAVLSSAVLGLMSGTLLTGALTGCALWPSNRAAHTVEPTADMRAASAMAESASAAAASSASPTSSASPPSPASEASTPSTPESLWAPMPMAPIPPSWSGPETLEPLPGPASASAASSPATPAAATSATQGKSGTSGDLMPGRFAVQIGVFLVPSNAETIRARTAERLANESTLKASDKEVRSFKKGQRTYVVVGDVADRNAAEFLAARLRLLLDQDVVVFKR